MTDESSMRAESAESWAPHNPWLLAMTVMLPTFMEILDTSIANVALPHIAGNLSASVDESTWVLTSYLVSNAIILPLSGWFSTLLGRKRFYLICVVLFTVSSFMCGLAMSISSLVLFRIFQGAGGGALQPIAQSILVESFVPAKRGMAMAIYGMGVVVAPIIGPTLGGWITDNYSWRWVFFINIPVGITAVFLATILLKDPPYLVRRKAGEFKMDYIGLGLIAVGLGALQLMLDKGQREDWFDSRFITVLFIIVVVCVISAVFWELRQKNPVVDLRLLKNRNFSFGVFMMYVLGFSLYGSTVLLPLFLQTLMGYTAELSGLTLSPGGIVTMITMPIVGFLVGRFQPRWLIIFGLVIGAAGLFQSAGFNLQISYWDVVLSRMMIGAGIGFLFVSINTAAYFYVDKSKTDYASGLINLSRNLGASAGISFVATMLSRRAQFHQTVLIGHVSENNPLYGRIFNSTRAALLHQGVNAAEAAIKAKALIYKLVQQQANMLAFIDNFYVLAFIFVFAIPVVLFMKKITVHKKTVPVH